MRGDRRMGGMAAVAAVAAGLSVIMRAL